MLPPELDEGLLWLGFWSADWTPWPAIRQLRRCWPGLRLAVQPHYIAMQPHYNDA